MSDEGITDEGRKEVVIDYWFKHYVKDHCTLCGNWGWIDSRTVKTPAGVPVGRFNWCICPNGQALREGIGSDVPSEQFLLDQVNRSYRAL